MVSHNLMLSRSSSSSRASQSPQLAFVSSSSSWPGPPCLHLRVAGVAPPRTDPQSATTVGVRSPLWFLSAERATWLILPVAYACLKD